jgi:hypothetical protein
LLSAANRRIVCVAGPVTSISLLSLKAILSVTRLKFRSGC